MATLLEYALGKNIMPSGRIDGQSGSSLLSFAKRLEQATATARRQAEQSIGRQTESREALLSSAAQAGEDERSARQQTIQAAEILSLANMGYGDREKANEAYLSALGSYGKAQGTAEKAATALEQHRGKYGALTAEEKLEQAYKAEDAARAQLEMMGSGYYRPQMSYTQAMEELERAQGRVDALGGKSGASWLRGTAQQYGGNLLSGVSHAADTQVDAGVSYAKALAELNAQEARNMGLYEQAEMLERSGARLDADKERSAVNAYLDKGMATGRRWAQEGSAELEAAKGGKGQINRVLIDIGSQALQMAADRALGLGTLATVPMALRSFGGATEEALAEGADETRARLYGAATAAVEGLTEKIADGVAGVYGKGAADDLTDYIVGKLASTAVGRRVWSTVMGAVGEGGEEVLSDLAGVFTKSIYNNKSFGQNLSELDAAQVGYDFLIGAALGFLGGSVEGLSGTQSASAEFFQNARNNGLSFRQATEAWNGIQEAAAKANGVQQLTESRQPPQEEAQGTGAINSAENATEALEAAQTAKGAENAEISDAGRENRADGIGAGGSAGVLPAAAGEAEGRGRTDALADGGSLGNPAPTVLREVTPAALGIRNGSSTQTVRLIDPATAGESTRRAAEAVRNVGLEPVAYEGDMIVGRARVAGYIENGRIYYRTDAADRWGNPVSPEAIVDHELFHEAADRDGTLVGAVRYLVQNKMTENEFSAMRDVYLDAYSKVQDFTGWSAEEIADYLDAEISADAYAGLGVFSGREDIVEEVRQSAPQVGQAQTEQAAPQSRGPPAGHFSLSEYEDNRKEGDPKYVIVDGSDVERKERLLATAYDQAISGGKGIEISQDTIEKYTAIYNSPEESLLDAVKEYYDETLKGTSVVVAVNNGVLEIRFENDGKKKSVGWRLKPSKAATFEKLKQMTENAEYAYSEENRNPNERMSIPLFHYFVNNANIDGQDIPVKIQVRDVITNEDVKETHYYTHTLEKNKRGNYSPVAGTKGTNIDSNARVSSKGTVPQSPEEVKGNSSKASLDVTPYDIRGTAEVRELVETGETSFMAADGEGRRLRMRENEDGSFDVTVIRPDGRARTSQGHYGTKEEAAREMVYTLWGQYQEQTPKRGRSVADIRAEEFLAERRLADVPPETDHTPVEDDTYAQRAAANEAERRQADVERRLAAGKSVTVRTERGLVRMRVQRDSRGRYYGEVRDPQGQRTLTEFYPTADEAVLAAMDEGEVWGAFEPSLAQERTESPAPAQAAPEQPAPAEPEAAATTETTTAITESAAPITETTTPTTEAQPPRTEEQVESDALADSLAEGNPLDDPSLGERRSDVEKHSPEEYWETVQAVASPVQKTRAEEDAEAKVSTRVEEEETPRKERLKAAVQAAVRTMVNTGEAIHRIGLEVGDRSLDGYFFRALASTQAAANWIGKKRAFTDKYDGGRSDVQGRRTGKSLSEILDPVRAKGEDYYTKFQLYLLHEHNVDRMNVDFRAETAEAQARVDALLGENPWLVGMTPTAIAMEAQGLTERALAAEDYLHALRELERWQSKRPKPVFGYEVTAEDSRAAADRLLRENPEFKELAREVYAYTNDLLQYRVDSGLITAEEMAFLQQKYPHYIPTYRARSKTEQKKAIRWRGDKLSTGIGRATGGDTGLLPLHQTLARQTASVLRNGGINQLSLKLLEHQAQLGDYILDVTESGSGFDIDTFDGEDWQPRAENMRTAFKDGTRYNMVLDDGLSAAYKTFDPKAREDNAILKFFEGANNLFKALCTGYSPWFLIRNAIRDPQDAMLYSVDSKRWLQNFPKAWEQIAKDGEYWQQYKALGGGYGALMNYATGEMQSAKRWPGMLLERFELLNQWVEAAPRLAEFMTILQRAEADHGSATEADILEAFHGALDVTTNFGRSGSLGGMLNRYAVPFLNPSIQGLDKAIRTLSETKGAKAWGKLALKAALLGIVPAVLNELLYWDDEDWAELDAETKSNNYLFKVNDGIFIKIPRGRAVAVLTAPATLSLELPRGDEPTLESYFEAGKDLWNIVKTNMSPTNIFTSNILTAWHDTKLFDPDDPGTTWYGGDIESQRLRNYAPGQRYDEKTDVISKWIGGVTNLSPKKINYLIDQYSGVLGDLLLPLLTPQAEQNPFMAAFTIDTTSGGRSSEEYYDLLDELKWERNGGSGTAGLAYKYVNARGDGVSDAYAQIREIEADPNLTDKEKKTLARELRKTLQAQQKQIVESARAYQEAAEAYVEEHPALNWQDEDAVEAYMAEYNAGQSEEKYYKDAAGAASLMEAIVYREVNREVMGAEYALETYSNSVYSKAQELNASAGVSYESYYDYYFGTKDMHADRDENGKSISGSKKEKVLGFINAMDIPTEQKQALGLAAGYTENSLRSAPWNTGSSGKSSGGRGGGSRAERGVSVNSLNLPSYSYDYDFSLPWIDTDEPLTYSAILAREWGESPAVNAYSALEEYDRKYVHRA